MSMLDLFTGVDEDAVKTELVKAMLSNSAYTGKLQPIFEDIAVDVYDILAIIRRETADGFQFKDLGPILTEAAPELYEFYQKISSNSQENKEEFFKELIIYAYYEAEQYISVPGFLKWLFRAVLKIWVAPKLAKYLVIAFEYVEGKAVQVKGAALEFVQDIIAKL